MAYAVDRDAAHWRVVDGEAVVVNVQTTYYYGLNRTGTFLWGLLVEQPLEVDELVRRVSERYHRPAAEVAQDVRQIVKDLAQEGLIREV